MFSKSQGTDGISPDLSVSNRCAASHRRRSAHILIEIRRYKDRRAACAPLRGFGGCPTEQVAGDVDQREPSSFLRQFGTVGFKEHRLVAG